MAIIEIGKFAVTITAAGVDTTASSVVRTTPASVVAGPNNVGLLLTLKDVYGNLVSGVYPVVVTYELEEWFNSPVVDFVAGVASIAFAVTEVGVYVDVPVEVTE